MAMAEKFGFAAAEDDKCYTVAGYAQTTYSHCAPIPELKWLHAIANGGARGDNEKSRAIRGGQLKAEGVKRVFLMFHYLLNVANIQVYT